MLSKSNRENRALLVAHLARLDPTIPPMLLTNTIDRLGDLGARIHRHEERMCSYESYYNQHTDQNGEDMTGAKLEVKAEKLAAQIGCQVICRGDPRGYCLYVKRDGLRGNTWGGDDQGWGLN